MVGVPGAAPLSILWDMGGTLYDTYPDVNAALAGSLTRHGHEVSLERIGELTRVSADHAIATLARDHAVPEADLRADYDALKKRWASAPAPLMDGAAELMEAAWATGGLNIIVTHRDEASARTLLDATGVRVDDMICAPSGYPRKPDPTMMTIAMARHGLDPAHTIAIGDRHIDLEAARRAGITGYGLNIGPTPISSLRELLPH